MNRPLWISLAALLLLVFALPAYALLETNRMRKAEINLQEQLMVEGMDIYIQNCASCHGANGAGIGMLPPLNNPALAEAKTDMLFNSIARASHGTAMAAWHVNEGGILNDYQLKEIVTVIQHADWQEVENIAYKKGFSAPLAPAIENGKAYLESEVEEDPHQCFACHEEPALHAGSFGTNCARCHNAVTWKPAVLTKHTFLLDHGGQGDVDCKTCHPTNYVEYDCYSCHENHQASEIEDVHLAEGISAYDDCADCHQTGISGEAGMLRDAQKNIEVENATIWHDSKLINLAMQPGEK